MCASPADGTLLDALLSVHAVLDEEGVEHALCGGIAANLYRDEIRATSDVDLYIVCSAPQLVSLARGFERRGFQVHPAWQKAELLRLTRDGMPRVDLLVATTDLEAEAVTRAALALMDGIPIRVLLPEDLIVFKLVAGRARDYEATAAILNAGGRVLDQAFIASRLALLGMEDRWKRALEEAKRESEGRG